VGAVALTAGQVLWCDLDPTMGREQGGRRPCVVMSSTAFGRATDGLVIAVPCTSRDRGWVNHVLLSGPTGLTNATFAITEQPRAMSVERIHGVAGHVDNACLALISRWVHAWLQPAA
jgi:mRNA interferase MazF